MIDHPRIAEAAGPTQESAAMTLERILIFAGLAFLLASCHGEGPATGNDVRPPPPAAAAAPPPPAQPSPRATPATPAMSASPAMVIALEGKWHFKLGDEATAKQQGWTEAAYDDSQWGYLQVPGTWNAQGLHFGTGWYRMPCVIPAEWRGRALVLRLPAGDDYDETYVNGRKIGGSADWSHPRTYLLDDASINWGGRNLIAVKVGNGYGDGGLTFGPARIEALGPFAPQAPEAAAAPPLELGLTEDLAANGSPWMPTWRDEGTSDTRPHLASADGDRPGSHALEIDAWFPESAEYVARGLPKDRDGAVWRERGADYLSFWYQSTIEGDIDVRLSPAVFRWKGGSWGWGAKVHVYPGGWRRAVLPFTGIGNSNGRTNAFEAMPDPGSVRVISIGYGNNELRQPGKIRLSAFQVGKMQMPAVFTRISMDGMWRLSADPGDAGLAAGWSRTDWDDARWPWIPSGRDWYIGSPGHGFLGVGWYRQQVWIPPAWKGLDLSLELGKPDDEAIAFFNGREVGRSRACAPLICRIPAAQVSDGQLNSIAVRILNTGGPGGLLGSPSIEPVVCALGLAPADDGGPATAPAEFDISRYPGRRFRLTARIPAALAADGDRLAFECRSCFHRIIAAGRAEMKAGVATVELDDQASHDLFQSETFDFRGLLEHADGAPVAAFAALNQQMRYGHRDEAHLPESPASYLETAFGRLRLIDRIDCAVDPDHDEHPYKEGGIRASWVGLKAYSSWERGIRIGELQGRKYREANNNEWFAYRIGRGSLKPHHPYLLRIVYPEDKSRYCSIGIQAGRNYQGKGFKTGIDPQNPFAPYPRSGGFEVYDSVVIPDDVTYGWQGARTAPGSAGIWVFFFDNGRCYSGDYESGPAAAEIQLLDIDDPAAAAPVIRYPAGEPHRRILIDWEREPEIRGDDAALYARLIGVNAIAPAILKWTHNAFWPTHVPGINIAGLPDPDLPGALASPHQSFLDGTRKWGVDYIPRLEFGGRFDDQPPEATAIGPDGRPAPPGRYCNRAIDLLHPSTKATFDAILGETIGASLAGNPQIQGVLWRVRMGRLPISYNRPNVEAFARDQGLALPSLPSDGDYARWASSTEHRAAYENWWHRRRMEFQQDVLATLRSYGRNDLDLYYYNWDADGWHLGGYGMQPRDWTDFYSRSRAREFHQRVAQHQSRYKPEDYLDMVKHARLPEDAIRCDLYGKVEGIHVFCPLWDWYLADDAAYQRYFITGSGLAISHQFTYEEKGRNNVQQDNHETCEMTPGGPAFSMTMEVMAWFNGDANVVSTTAYTYGRGFVGAFRTFAQAFLALPDRRGTVIPEATGVVDPDIMVRRYDTPKAVYLGIGHRGFIAKPDVGFHLPGTWPESVIVTDLVSGDRVPARIINGNLAFSHACGPMRLDSLRVDLP